MSQSTDPEALTVIATYRVQPGQEEPFERLLRAHHPALASLGLVTSDPPVVYRGQDESGGAVYYEIFTWKDAKGPNVAHEAPEIMAIWEPMGAITEARGGRPQFEFPHVRSVTL